MVTAGDGALELVGLQLSDAGVYTCQQGDTAIHTVNLRSGAGVVSSLGNVKQSFWQN